MVELVLVRHGETDSNTKMSFLGWTDVPLNSKSIGQAKNTGTNLKDTKFKKLFSSPLKRTYETAEIINEYHNLNICTSNDLKERNFGIWDDLTLDEIKKSHFKEYELWTKDWVNYCIQEGESAKESYDRAKVFVDKLLKEETEGTFLIVTHLGQIRNILAYLFGGCVEKCWHYRVDNGSVTIVEINEGFPILKKLNC